MEPRPILICLVLALAAVAAGCSSAPSQDGAPFVPTTGAPSANADPSAAVSQFAADVNTTLEEIDRNVASAARELGRSGLAGPEATAALGRLAASSPHIADAVAISPDGRIAAAMPAEFAAAVGADVRNQSHVGRGLAEKRPLMSEVFRAVEGFDAVVIQHPVAGSDGRFLGLVSAVVEPELLLSDRSDRAVAGTGLTAWVMAPDGRVVYDPDPDEIGRNVISDPLYAGHPELVALAKRIGTEPSGSGSYSFTPTGGGAAVKKDAVWTTAGLHGTAWRIVVVREG